MSALISAKRVQGTQVTNPRFEDLGHIEDVMIEKLTGRIAYAVISFGGFLGLGQRHFAVPWSALRYDTEREAYVIDVERDDLSKAPGFSRDEAPDLSAADWRRRIQDYWDRRP